jgi:hydrogenase nickel incorporation protein HypA/HybF
MHEMSIAVALLERVLDEAAKGGLRTVTRVSVDVGALQSVEPELLIEAFLAAAHGSAAQGAQLNLQIRPARALCLACGADFQPNYRDYACPRCGKAEVQILEGRDLFLLDLSGEADEAEAGHHRRNDRGL